MNGECSVYVIEEYLVQSFGGKPEGRRLVLRPRLRWHYIIKEVEWEDIRCVLHQDIDQCQVLVNLLMNL
jgi:hypothetical protein